MNISYSLDLKFIKIIILLLDQHFRRYDSKHLIIKIHILNSLN